MEQLISIVLEISLLIGVVLVSIVILVFLFFLFCVLTWAFTPLDEPEYIEERIEYKWLELEITKKSTDKKRLCNKDGSNAVYFSKRNRWRKQAVLGK